jgi:gliding motility-associated-like protein
VNLGDSSGYATDGMGAYLSADTVQDYSTGFNLPYVPQIANPTGNILTDHVNWVLISGEYNALGGKKFITIGNFKDDASSNTQQVSTSASWLFWSYYYVEDLYVGPCDTTILTNNSNISAPNIFTPNNDGANDSFKITYKNITTLNCKIYNRWGLLVSELKNANDTWNGKTADGLECTNGVYYYIITATGEDGKEYNEKGFVQIIK